MNLCRVKGLESGTQPFKNYLTAKMDILLDKQSPVHSNRVKGKTGGLKTVSSPKRLCIVWSLVVW